METASNTSHLFELEQFDLRVQVGGWGHVREINRQPDITSTVGRQIATAVAALAICPLAFALASRLARNATDV